MTNAPNLREKIVKSVLTVAVSYGCGRSRHPASHGTCASLHGGLFHDFLTHLQHLSHSRYGSN